MEISVFEDFTSVFFQPEAYQQIAHLSVGVDVPMFMPSSLDVFTDLDAYVAAAYGAVGNDPTQIPAVDSAVAVSNNRFLIAAQVNEFLPIEGCTEFVFGSVTLDEFGDAMLILPSVLAQQSHEFPIVWCACDKVDSLEDYHSFSYHDPHVLFRAGLQLASQYAPITLWQLMTEVGEGWSAVLALITTLKSEGYRVRRTSGPAELFFVEQLLSSHVPLSPSADADMGCEAMLIAIDSLLRDAALRADPAVGDAAKLLARQVLSKIPTRVLAKFAGKDTYEPVKLEQPVQPPQAVGCPAIMQGLKINVYDHSTWERLHQSRSLIKATLCHGPDGDFASIFTVGSLVGDCVELECIVTSRLLLVHPSSLRDISIAGHAA